MDESNILEVKDLLTTFRTERGLMKAVDGVSFQVKKGEILGVVGESGCGKSVTSQSIMRLYDEKRTARYSGEILLNGDNLLKKTEKEMREIRGRDVAMVFQDALSSLNPVIKIGEQIMEPLRIHQHISTRIGVMYLGHLLEQAYTDDLFGMPMHPYTQALFSAVPETNPHIRKTRIVLKGEVPSPLNPPSGCVFHTRCPYAMPICKTVPPCQKEISRDHFVSCHLYDDEVSQG